MTSNLGKFSISCKVLIMGNPYSSTEIPLGNVIKWKWIFLSFWELFFNSAIFFRSGIIVVVVVVDNGLNIVNIFIIEIMFC